MHIGVVVNIYSHASNMAVCSIESDYKTQSEMWNGFAM